MTSEDIVRIENAARMTFGMDTGPERPSSSGRRNRFWIVAASAASLAAAAAALVL